MKFIFDDGGRLNAGYKGLTGDCVTRSIAIAMEKPYQEVYEAMSHGNFNERKTSKTSGKKTASRGIHVKRKWFKDYMKQNGWKFTPTMSIGSGCTVHLKEDELPKGRLIVSVSKHSVAVIDGVIHDTHDPSRDETRCVYGYWKKEAV